VTSSLGVELKARRKAAGLTQVAVAEQLGVARPTLTQWEADRHRPTPEHLSQLDELYGARGELIKLAQAEPDRDDTTPQGAQRFVADIFRDVADALVDTVVVDEDGRPRGWCRNLTGRTRPTLLSTAFVVRTLQLLDEARVDLHALADFFERSEGDAGWGYSRMVRPRPEVTAIVLVTLSRLGRLADVETALGQLETGLDEVSLSRPYVLTVVLEALLAIRPDAPLAGRLVRRLLDARRPFAGRLLWTMDASAQPELVQPSLAHTARATAVLRLARPTTSHRSAADEAIDMAVGWMASLHKGDDSVIEILPSTSEDRPEIAIHHFTAAWAIRAMAGVGGVPAPRLQAALDVLWDSYSPSARLWVWRDDGTVPSWMTLDAVSALRAMAEASLPTPIFDGDPR
jgi:transcriptional regulator with XRE-family HTH domain